jgi:ABC-type sugar transport system permease subunit
MIGPGLYALYASFTNWMGLESPRFVGLNNYTNVFKDIAFRRAMVNNAWYSGASVFIVVPLAFILSLLFNARWLKSRGLFRAVYFMPYVTSGVVIGIIFSLLYNYHYGLINWALQAIGLPAIDWLGTREWVKPAIVGLIMWQWTGHHMVYFLAGLQGIPQQIYEAALVDGANWFQSLVHVTIPLLRPTILFVVVTTTIGSLQIFDAPNVLTGGGPADASLSLAMYLYRVGFQYMRLGFGCAVGFVMFAIIFTLSMVQTRLFGLFREE